MAIGTGKNTARTAEIPLPCGMRDGSPAYAIDGALPAGGEGGITGAIAAMGTSRRGIAERRANMAKLMPGTKKRTVQPVGRPIDRSRIAVRTTPHAMKGTA